ncbi:MAG: helix-turn-helix domain-containing protein [Candidatus Limnocylindria bacterium]
MQLHRNARLGLRGRHELVLAIESGMSLKAAAAAFSVSPATAHRWWHRWRAAGHVRPGHVRGLTPDMARRGASSGGRTAFAPAGTTTSLPGVASQARRPLCRRACPKKPRPGSDPEHVPRSHGRGQPWRVRKGRRRRAATRRSRHRSRYPGDYARCGRSSRTLTSSRWTTPARSWRTAGSWPKTASSSR